MKTLIGKYKELVAKLKETVMHVGFGTDTPIADLQKELNDAKCPECKGLAKEIFRIESEIAELEQRLKGRKSMTVAYIAHPIGGNVQANLKKISDIARQINLSESFTIPFAHYFFDCYSLNDDVPEERERGIRNDIALMGMGFIDEIRLYGDRISKGMKNEIWMAEKFNIPVTPMTPQTAKEFYEYLSSRQEKPNAKEPCQKSE